MSCRDGWIACGMDQVHRPSSDVWEASSRLRKASQADGVPSATRGRLQELAAEAEFIAGALAIVEGSDA